MRKRFKYDDKRRAYEVCFTVHAKLEKWKKEKAKLLKTLMFFAISKLSGDDSETDSSKFIEFTRDYHERWGIENGFRDVKSKFLSKGRSRRPCVRQFRLVLAIMLYNRWEVERKRIALAWMGSHATIKDANDKPRPWIRRKYEIKCHEMPTAVGFLVEALQCGILSLVKNKIQ